MYKFIRIIQCQPLQSRSERQAFPEHFVCAVEADFTPNFVLKFTVPGKSYSEYVVLYSMQINKH
jgi:hypothetical protein